MNPRSEERSESPESAMFNYRDDPSTSYDLSNYLNALRLELGKMREKRAEDPYPDVRYTPEEEVRMMFLEKKFVDLPRAILPSSIPGAFSSPSKLRRLIDNGVPIRILPRMVENAFANTRRVPYEAAPGLDIVAETLETFENLSKGTGEEHAVGIDAPFAYSIDALIFDKDVRAGNQKPQWVTLGLCAFRIIPGIRGSEDVIQVDHLTGPEKFLRVDDELDIRQTFTPAWAAALWVAVQYARSCGMKKILIRKPEHSHWEKVRRSPDASPYGRMVNSDHEYIRKALGIIPIDGDPENPAYNVFALLEL